MTFMFLGTWSKGKSYCFPLASTYRVWAFFKVSVSVYGEEQFNVQSVLL